MAKRFIDTDIWNKAWFRKLDGDSKMVWVYLFCRCDMSGVWSPDFEQADFHIGKKINWSAVRDDLLGKNGHPSLFENVQEKDSPRIQILPNGKWLVLDFIDFQYGELVPACRPHQKILELVHKHGIGSVLKTNTGKPRSDLEGLPKPENRFDEFWELYPLKKEKEGAKKKYEIAISKLTNHQVIMEGLKRYVAWIGQNQVQDKYIKHPKTWLGNGCWLDTHTTSKKTEISMEEIYRKLSASGAVKYTASLWVKIPANKRKLLEIESTEDGQIIKLKDGASL